MKITRNNYKEHIRENMMENEIIRLLINNKLTEYALEILIEKNKNKPGWKYMWFYISEYQILSEEFIEKYEDKVYWESISIHQQLSENFIEKYEDRVDWFYISINQILSEKFIEKYEDKVYWEYISKYQKLSGQFIEKYKNKVDWEYISKHKTLSEKFIEKHKNEVYWKYISIHQKLSEEFIKKHKKIIDKDIEYRKKIAIEYNCGDSNRNISIYKDKPEIIRIGCFKGTREKAIEKIKYEYKDKKQKEYIEKVNSCFKQAEEYLDKQKG